MENLEPTKKQGKLSEAAPAALHLRLKKNTGIILMSLAFAVMLWQVIQIYLHGMRHVTQGLLLIVGICLPLIVGTPRGLADNCARRARRRAS